MRLSVPCNWDPTLLETLSSHSEIYEMTGAMQVTPVGGGRPAMITNGVTEDVAEAVVDAAHRNGWQFCYLLNASCMGNMEFDVKIHKEVRKHLDWISDIGVDTVTVTIPYLVELIKSQYPWLKVRISLIAGVNSIPKARYFRELGADSMTVDYMKNRDVAFLRALVQRVPGSYTLLVNDQCLFQCPYRSYHYNACGHGSQSWDRQSNFYLDYSMVRCTVDKLKRPERLIMMPWIRPEDLAFYEELGFDTFKISGRHMPTDGIVRAVNAYVERRFDGNLLTILNPFVNADDSRYPHVDNRALDGFLSEMGFRDCENECDACDYCASVARRAVRMVDPDAAAKYLESLERHIDGLAKSRFMPDVNGGMEGR